MNDYSEKNRRKYQRYDSDVKINFFVNFDVNTKIDYRIKKNPPDSDSSKKYPGFSKNISAEGICFLSEKKLKKGDMLVLEIYIPAAKSPIQMEGIVRWSHKDVNLDRKEDMPYETGVLLIEVEGKSVEKSVYFDQSQNLVWSNVLESIFGNFKKFALNRKNTMEKTHT